MSTTSRPRNWDGTILTDAQAEALSRVAWREAGKPFATSGRRATSPATWRKLGQLGLVTKGGSYGILKLTDEGARVAAKLPEWDWSV